MPKDSPTGTGRAALSVEAIMASAWAPARCRTPRSPEYKAGMRAALAYRLCGTRIPIPHRPGAAAFDAYFSGVDEGHAAWRNTVEQEVDHAEA